MNKYLDNFFNSIFGGMGIGLVIFNGILGLSLIVIGILLNKKSSSKNKKTVGIVCVGIGILAVINAIIQLVLSKPALE
jgi:ABC-type Fe3+-siderophore transport system permease subunit